MSSTKSLPQLVENLVPESRNDTRLKEALVEQCTLILRRCEVLYSPQTLLDIGAVT